MGPVRGALQKMTIVTLLVAVLCASPGTAQEPYHPELEFDAEVSPHPDPVEPVAGEGTAHITLKVTCVPPGISISPQRVDLHLEVEDELRTVAVLSSVSLFVAFDDAECIVLPATKEYDFTAVVSFSADSPAYEESELRLFASYDDKEHLIAEWSQQAGFFERWDARFDQSILKAAQGEHIQVPGMIENQGNGPIQVEFLRNQGPEFGEIVLPRPLKVRAGESENIERFHVDYKGHDTGRDGVSIRFVGTSLDDPSIKLDPTTKNFVVQVQWSPAGEAPVAPTAMLGLALLGVLMTLRRNQQSG